MRKLWFLLTVLLIAVGISMAQTGTGAATNGTQTTGTTAQSGSTNSNSTAATPDQNTTGTSAATPDQTGAAGATANTPDQTNTGTAGANADQNSGAAATNSGATGTKRHGKLPQTATDLPTLAVIGIGMLVGGIFGRRLMFAQRRS